MQREVHRAVSHGGRIRGAGVLLLGIALVGCSGQAASTPAVTGGPSPVATPSVTPLPTAAPGTPAPSTPAPSSGGGQTPAPATPGPGRIVVGSIATVVTDGLRVRSLPGTGADSKKLVPLLNHGTNLFVVAGPVVASGLDWYQVQTLRPSGRLIDAPFGWVAAGKDGETWVSGGIFACPALPTDYARWHAMDPYLVVACHGRAPITFAATLGRPEATCGVDPGWTIKPLWLGNTCASPEFLIADTSRGDAIFDAVLAPTIDVTGLDPGTEPADWIAVRVTGHYDDEASATCRIVAPSADARPDIGPAQAILACRTKFVITSIKR
jgi:hypothetical protein